jgi:thiamine-phosphate pyrophosphorylase
MPFLQLQRRLILIVHPKDLSHQRKLWSIKQVIEANALDMVQLRMDENTPVDTTFLSAGIQLREMTKLTNTKLIVNSCIESAHEIEADGLHIKEKNINSYCSDDIKILKRKYSWIVGCSAHSVDSALDAAQSQYDYIQVGTMFPTQSHPNKIELEGPALIKLIRRNALLQEIQLPPLIAIGGIDIDNIRFVVEAGADGVAVIRSLLLAKDTFERSKDFVDLIKQLRCEG